MLTWIEINASALKYNLAQFKKYIGPKVALLPVIKSNAYGHGLLEIAKILQKNKNVDRICVVSLGEALELRNNTITKPIFVLSNYENDLYQLAKAIKRGVVLSVFTLAQAKAISKAASKVKQKAIIHVELDSGTTRVGVLPTEFITLVKKIEILKNITIEGVWTHFSSSETNTFVTQKQFAITEQMVKNLKNAGITVPFIHTAYTAATLLHKNTHVNGVRVGLGIYGLYPSEKTQSKIKLKPVLSWKTKVIQIKTIPAKTKIGYNRTYTAKRGGTIAVLPVGYADGYDRHLSNSGIVLINGKPCPVRGRVCMNLTMVDVSKIPGVKVGSIVTLIGRDRAARITPELLAKKCHTINYEIVTRINPLLPRLVR